MTDVTEVDAHSPCHRNHLWNVRTDPRNKALHKWNLKNPITNLLNQMASRRGYRRLGSSPFVPPPARTEDMSPKDWHLAYAEKAKQLYEDIMMQ